MTGSPQELRELAAQLAHRGVVGLTIVWADNNGIPRSRTVPVWRLAEVAERGVGVSTLFAVFDSHDGITFSYDGMATPSGDVRLVPVVERLVPLHGQPGFAWAPGRQIAADGSPWPYDQRAVLERQVAAAAAAGVTFRAGWEMEFVLSSAGSEIAPGGPAYSPVTLLSVDEFAATLLRDLDANGLRVNQFHAEYGPAQFEFSLLPSDPLSAADDQLLARQTLHAAARAHGLRVTFAPMTSAEVIGNGWHLHVSVLRDGRELLPGDGPHGLSAEGGAFLAGLLRDLPALTAVTAPSVPSRTRLRPGYFSGAYAFWGVENREAALRYIPATPLLGDGNANIELKPCDASANPYLALAAVISSGLAGLADGLTPPEPVAVDPGGWPERLRAEHGVMRLPETPQEQLDALKASERVSAVLGPELLGAFRAVRESDLAWAADRSPAEVIQAHLWRY